MTVTSGGPAPALHAELEVLETGPLSLLQDLGRPGLAAYGVGRSGAADRGAFLLGARLLGQGPGHAAVEVTHGGLVMRARGSVTVVLTGAPAPASVDGRPAPHAAPFLLRAGQTLRLGPPVAGLRTYLSVRGGFAVEPVLGSRSTDILSGIGPPPLRPGDVLPVEPPVGEPTVDVAPVAPPTDGLVVLQAVLGPRADWLADPTALGEQTWTVSSRSDRVGLRLEGTALAWHPDRADDELPSEGVVRGAVQVPAGGQPVLFLADHPVTGGYPVVAVVVETDVDRAAQAVPGQQLRLRLQPP
ncbi:biotin-dependent carboxyltransferase family protein [Knoellia sp. p5-6-4]|uniref:5-oxoprolinase subunit C family protein n=1 Tax=unclassified Knoellia TaxID=2618719 RepID=UPI0023D9D0D0|nr:biotin-dependent carboxyltransferase family protein [Knoellia sp. p5-6-4]MDF2146380.1 biotin-dependent carboxyltransferase family protein [Knoellia sp. p5-6-4]